MYVSAPTDTLQLVGNGAPLDLGAGVLQVYLRVEPRGLLRQVAAISTYSSIRNHINSCNESGEVSIIIIVIVNSINAAT